MKNDGQNSGSFFLLLFGVGAWILLSATLGFAQNRRALIVGSNSAPPGLFQLQYAHADAKKLGAVLMELGGIKEDAISLLMNPSSTQLQAALKTFRQEAGAEDQLFFYYSGHANEKGLFLGDDYFPIAQIREFLADERSQVRVAILDSCQSGAVTQTKGGTMHPGVDIRWEAQPVVQGAILITSSTAEEASVERDDLGGSLFSHFFVSGLRGAADKNQDRKVTLQEAFAYSYDNTLARSTESRTGLQHPTYEYRIAGQRELVVSWLKVESFIDFDEKVAGSFVVFDRYRSQVVAELNKELGVGRRLWLPPGDYYIKKRLPSSVLVQKVGLPKGGVHRVQEHEMHTIPYQEDVTKGSLSQTFYPTWKYGAPFLENTAHTLRRGEMSLGFQRAQLGLNDEVMFSMNLGSGILFLSPSLLGKFQLARTQDFLWSVNTGYLVSYFGRAWASDERTYMQLRTGTTVSWLASSSWTFSASANWLLESGPSGGENDLKSSVQEDSDAVEWEVQLGSLGGSITWNIGEHDLIQVSADARYTFLGPRGWSQFREIDWGGKLLYAHSWGVFRLSAGVSRLPFDSMKFMGNTSDIAPAFDFWWRW